MAAILGMWTKPYVTGSQIQILSLVDFCAGTTSKLWNLKYVIWQKLILSMLVNITI